MDLSLAAPSHNVSDLRSLPATWVRREKKDEICPSLSAALRAEGQVEVTLTVTIVKHLLMHLQTAAFESLQRTLLSRCYNVIYYILEINAVSCSFRICFSQNSPPPQRYPWDHCNLRWSNTVAAHHLGVVKCIKKKKKGKPAPCMTTAYEAKYSLT